MNKKWYQKVGDTKEKKIKTIEEAVIIDVEKTKTSPRFTNVMKI